MSEIRWERRDGRPRRRRSRSHSSACNGQMTRGRIGLARKQINTQMICAPRRAPFGKKFMRRPTRARKLFDNVRRDGKIIADRNQRGCCRAAVQYLLFIIHRHVRSPARWAFIEINFSASVRERVANSPAKRFPRPAKSVSIGDSPQSAEQMTFLFRLRRGNFAWENRMKNSSILVNRLLFGSSRNRRAGEFQRKAHKRRSELRAADVRDKREN